MALRHISSGDTIKRLKRTQWKRQQTFPTPLNRLPVFVGAMLSECPDLQGGTLLVDSGVFEPRKLNAFLEGQGLPPVTPRSDAIKAESPAEAHVLLERALSEWLDFFFVVEPRTLLIYADHDEYTTVFAQKHSLIHRIEKSMASLRIEPVTDFERVFE